MHNTDKVPDCLVFNLPLLELHQVISWGPASRWYMSRISSCPVPLFCFKEPRNKLVYSAELLQRSRSIRYSLKRG